MDQRLEMAKLTREVLLDFIQPVQLLTLETDQGSGEVKGRFRSGPLLFEYSIKGEKVRYGPLGGNTKSAAEAGEQDQAKALPKEPQVRGDSPDQLQQITPAGPVEIEDTARGQWIQRGIHYLAKLWRQDAARVDAYLAAEVRLDAAGQKVCTVGYQCGNTCIARSKICIQEVQSAIGSQRLKKLGAMAMPDGLSEDPGDPGDMKHEALKAQRVAIGKQLMTRLGARRSDGKGTLMEYPDEQALALIKDVKKRREAIDRQLNRLEGRPLEEKRWYEDAGAYGLDRYTEPADQKKTPLGPGREAYEESVINRFVSKGAKGNQSIFMAGGPASGKTSLLHAKFGSDPQGFVTVDPDAIKGLLPEMQVGIALGIRGAAAITHEQSSRISKEVLRRARDGGLNFIMDGTGANSAKYVREMNTAREKGYTVDLLMQHVEQKVGVERAVSRADRVGRFVPRAFIEDAYSKIPHAWQALSAAADRATLNDSDAGVELAAVINGRTVATAGPAYKQFMRRYPQR